MSQFWPSIGVFHSRRLIVFLLTTTATISFLYGATIEPTSVLPAIHFQSIPDRNHVEQ